MRKVVTSQEMARIEQWAVQRGASPREFMVQAGQKVCAAAALLLQKRKGERVVLLIGRGNKGGDAYVAGIELMQAGFEVRAIPFYEASECSELNRHFAKQFSGEIDREIDFTKDDLIIDGLLGTGFHGTTESSPFAKAIELANQSGKPIIAIDIPSGLDGTTGICKGPAIRATETVTLGFAKIGLFKGSGWDCVGKLRIEDFGLSEAAGDEASAVARTAQLEEIHLPPMVRSHHKYERGFVVGFGGCKELKGAVKLSGAAALHAGAGIVKLFTLEDVGPMADELIAQIWNLAAWKETVRKASAIFIGPGLGRSQAAIDAWDACKAVLHGLDKPCVLDADALFFLSKMQTPPTCIVTPHRGEAMHLLGLGKIDEELLLARCQGYVEEHKVVLILKGAPTYIFCAGQLPVIVPFGDPGMATAGSGDVLTGILTALLAQGESLLEAAVLGVTLHALAGEAAAQEKTSYGYSASDLIEYLPSAFKILTT